MERFKLFWALSRTPHGLLDMTTPAFAALLWLGAFPDWPIVVLGLITTFAGYTAVYALNDIIDYRSDREKFRQGGFQDSGDYLDAAMARHPVAQGLLSMRDGLLWVGGWSALAIIGAYLLNPVCVLIFVGGCTLEVAYCLMWRVSPLRTIVSGGVKTSGAMAAVFAVDPAPSALYLLLLFLCLFFWEIGGQNVPADWTDIEEDARLKASTIPVRLGLDRAKAIVLGTVVLAIVVNGMLLHQSRLDFELPYMLAAILLGIYLLVWPAARLFRSKSRAHALALFNRASYYPAALCAVVLAKLLLPF
jgi:4-hydroxybenzoate polyprenyltransferase